VLRPRRGSTAPDDGWTSEVSSGLALAGFLGLVFMGFTLLAMGPLMGIDTYFNLATPPDSWLPFLHLMDRIGQRAVCLPILGVAAFIACRRSESWRPAIVAGAAVFALNLTVLILKVALGRDAPQSADPSFFAGGMAYPSGHSSNIVLVYGLIGYLLIRYADPGRALRILLWMMVPVLSGIMVFTSLTLNWHWFADLIAGLLVGGIILQLVASVDHAVPETQMEQGWRHALRHPSSVARGGKPSQPRASRGSGAP